MSDILVILMALLLSTWASELKEKKNLGGEAPAWRNGELSWEAETTISLSLCASEHGPATLQDCVHSPLVATQAHRSLSSSG